MYINDHENENILIKKSSVLKPPLLLLFLCSVLPKDLWDWALGQARHSCELVCIISMTKS